MLAAIVDKVKGISKDIAEAKQAMQAAIVSALEPKYIYERKLNDSLYGEVCVARCVGTGRRVCVKVSHKTQYIAKRTMAADNPYIESVILALMRGTPHIVELIDHIETDLVFCLVLQYLDQGDLFSQVEAHDLTEAEVKVIFGQIVSAVVALNKYGLAHLDISLENIAIEQCGSAKEPELWKVRLIDMGSVVGTVGYTITTFRQMFQGPCHGKHYYRDPAIIEYYLGRCTTPFDPVHSQVWSLGVLLYCMVMGYPPYGIMGDVNYIFATTGMWLTGEKYRSIAYPQSRWRDTASFFRTFVDSMIKLPPKRLTLDELSSHAWFQSSVPTLPLPMEV